jgi:hypothetical protein
MSGSGRTDVDHRARLDLKDKTSERNELKATAQVWRVSDPTSLPRLGMAATLSPILYGKAQVSDRYLVTRRLELEPGYKFEGAQVYEPGRPPGLVHSPYLDDWYHLSERTAVGLDYRFQYFSFGPEADHANAGFAAYRYRVTRELTLTARAGPVFWKRNVSGEAGTIPAANVALERQAGPWDLATEVGHDLVGASGFTAVLWADYAALTSTYRFSGSLRRWRVFGAAAYFRNGYADRGWRLGPMDDTSQGYAVDGGIEWRPNPTFAFQGTADRISQLGGNIYGGGQVVRDIVAVRLVVTAL